MNKITLLKDEKNGNKYGTCNGCGKFDDKYMRRIRFTNVSVCLCSACYKKLKTEIMRNKR